MIVKDLKLLAQMRRDMTLCEFCREVSAEEIHHIKPRGMGGGSRLDVAFNLVALCKSCHERAQANRIPDSVLWGIAAEREVRRLLRMRKEDAA